MQLELAVVLRCDDTTCHLELVEGDRRIDAPYSAPMREHDIRAEPGQLVAVDSAADPPQIVYRWARIWAEPGAHGYTLTREGQPIEPARVRADGFPRIEAMYARIEFLADLDPKQIVREGYDQIAERYLEWTQEDDSGMRLKYVSWLLDELPAGAPVLELGCGAGVPGTQMLARRFQVTAVDISARQIALARENVPQACFLQADMAALDLPPEGYSAVVALYALFHLPRDEQPQLLREIAAWLRSGGLLVVTMGTQASAGSVEEDWLGAPMYWSTFDSETNVRIVQEAGLDVVHTEIETVEEFDETVRFLWIVARKPRGST